MELFSLFAGANFMLGPALLLEKRVGTGKVVEEAKFSLNCKCWGHCDHVSVKLCKL